ncbi:unnamed protein product, partial [Meganyctiphanes norvegica]
MRILYNYNCPRCWRVVLGSVLALGIVSLVMLATTALTPRYSAYLLRSLEGPIPQDDPELLHFLINQVLEPPSTDPYNLLGKNNIALQGVDDSEVFYKMQIQKIFAEKTDGWFLEAGALDGETMSNTIWLEKERGWTGLLVEADPHDYEALKEKQRKAWSANCCLAPNPYPSKMTFTDHSHYAGPMAVSLGFKMRAMHALSNYVEKIDLGNSWFRRVQCIPLPSILSALKVSHLDLFSLDVEGAEMDILATLDFNKIEVDVLFLEWKRIPVIEEQYKVIKELETKGMVKYLVFKEDLIFFRKGSSYHKRMEQDLKPVSQMYVVEEVKKYRKKFNIS